MKPSLILLVCASLLVGCATGWRGTSADEPSDPPLRALLAQLKAQIAAIAEAEQVVSWCEANSSGGTIADSNGNQVTYSGEQVARIRGLASLRIAELRAQNIETVQLSVARIEQLYPSSASSSWSPYRSRVGEDIPQPFTPTYNAPVPSLVPSVSSSSLPRATYGSGNRFDPNSLANPYGAGSPYKADGLMNPYSQYGSPYSSKSWRNPYATDAPKLYDQDGKYLGRFSINRYDPDSSSNPYGRYGSPYSPDSINNPYGAGNPYGGPVYVVPQK